MGTLLLCPVVTRGQAKNITTRSSEIIYFYSIVYHYQIMNQVLDEIGIEMTGKMSAAPNAGSSSLAGTNTLHNSTV